MAETQQVNRAKRIFYAIVGAVCLFMSTAVLSRILRDLFLGVDFTYGRADLLIQHPALQTLHVIAACAIWTTVFFMGFKWLLRARSGREPLAL